MANRSRYWSDWSTRDFALLRQSGGIADWVAVLPIAAIEQHGPHLPLSVDADLADGIIEASLNHLAPDARVLFLPAQKIGKSNEHARFPGTLTLSATTLIALWTEIGECVARAGFRKLVMFNSHGGQVGMMDIVARDLRDRHDLLVFSTSWFSLPLDAAAMARFSAQEHRFGVHGGEVETSMMLALKPSLVVMDKARDFASASQQRAANYPILGDGKSVKLGWQMQDYNPQGAAGNAAQASPDKGRAVIASAASQLAAMLAEVERFPLAALIDRPADP